MMLMVMMFFGDDVEGNIIEMVVINTKQSVKSFKGIANTMKSKIVKTKWWKTDLVKIGHWYKQFVG